MSAQHLRDLNPERRHAVLAATALHLSRNLTDCAMDMFKKLIGALTRRADNQAAQRVTRSVRELQKPLKEVSRVCHVIINANDNGEDVSSAIDRTVQWREFISSVQAIDTLIAPDVVDGKTDLLSRYPTIRKMAPEFLSTFVFAATPWQPISCEPWRRSLISTGRASGTSRPERPSPSRRKDGYRLFWKMAGSTAKLMNSASSAN